MSRSKFAVAALALIFALPLSAVQAAPVATLDATKSGPRISRDIFGQFAEMLGEGIYGGVWVGPGSKIPNVRGIRSDVVAALRALKVPNVRWPGGCFADQYHWRDGVGPASSRRARVNVNWGGSLEPNTFGTHEYMDFVEQIGSEAYIMLNIGSGSVAEASDWMEYMTTDKPTTLGKERAANGRAAPWRISYLGIGNESWGCGGSLSADAYVETMKPYSVFAQNLNPAQVSTPLVQNPDETKRIAVGQGLGETAYTSALMKAWKERKFPYFWNIDGISLHHYSWVGHMPMADSSTDFGEAEYAQLLKNGYAMESMIAEHGAIMDQFDPEKKIAMVIDEWGAWLKPEPGRNPGWLRQQNSLRDAILASVTLNGFARHADRVRMSNIAQMVNVIQSMVLTDGPKMVLTPTYHVYRMYVPFQDAQLIPLTIDAGTYRQGDVMLSRVDAMAARAKDGSVWVALTNVDPRKEVSFDLAVTGLKAASAEGQQLTAAAVNSFNSFDSPQHVVPKAYRSITKSGRLPIRLPAKSVTVIRLMP